MSGYDDDYSAPIEALARDRFNTCMRTLRVMTRVLYRGLPIFPSDGRYVRTRGAFVMHIGKPIKTGWTLCLDPPIDRVWKIREDKRLREAYLQERRDLAVARFGNARGPRSIMETTGLSVTLTGVVVEYLASSPTAFQRRRQSAVIHKAVFFIKKWMDMGLRGRIFMHEKKTWTMGAVVRIDQVLKDRKRDEIVVL